jgi:DNA repair protein RadD
LGVELSRFHRALEGFFPGFVARLDEQLESDQSADTNEDAAASIQSISLVRSSQTVPLFDFQTEIIGQIAGFIDGSSTRALVSLPTGGGKTRIATYASLSAITSPESTVNRVLWIAPSKELLTQAMSTASDVWHAEHRFTDLSLQWASDSSKFSPASESLIAYATIQLLVSMSRKNASIGDFDLVVFDEAHHTPAPEFGRALEYVAENTKDPKLLGLTATPFRSDSRETPELFDFFNDELITAESLGQDPVAALQNKGVLASVRFLLVPITDADADETVVRIVSVARLCKQIIERNPDSKILIFASSVNEAAVVSATLRADDIGSVYVSGYLDSTERQRRIRAFEHGGINVLVNKSLLTTGYDFPAVNNVIMIPDVTSPVLFEQIAGRASRGQLVGGNARSTFWSFSDQIKIHGRPVSYARYFNNSMGRD